MICLSYLNQRFEPELSEDCGGGKFKKVRVWPAQAARLIILEDTFAHNYIIEEGESEILTVCGTSNCWVWAHFLYAHGTANFKVYSLPSFFANL